MKKGFMNKKAMDMTGWEVLKFTGILSIAMMAMIYIPMGIVTFWSSIEDWFSDRLTWIQQKLNRNKTASFEEDEEL